MIKAGLSSDHPALFLIANEEWSTVWLTIPHLRKFIYCV